MSGFFYNIMLKLDSVPTEVDGHLHFENIDIGVMTTVLGVMIVFLILVIICLLLTIFAMLVKDRSKNGETKTVTETPRPRHAKVSVKTAPSTAEPVHNEIDDKQLVAVITAAIAASMDTDADRLVVRRIRRVGNWNQEAIEQQQNGLY
jgi:sodium pump decarboxylase gamma subunit